MSKLRRIRLRRFGSPSVRISPSPSIHWAREPRPSATGLLPIRCRLHPGPTHFPVPSRWRRERSFPANEGTTVAFCSRSRITVPLVGWMPSAGRRLGLAVAPIGFGPSGGTVSFCFQRRRDYSRRGLAGFGYAERWARSDGRRRRLRDLQRIAQMIRRAFLHLRVLHLARGQQTLAGSGQLNIVRGVQILQNLLRHPLEYRRRDLPALVQSDRRIENHCHRNRWIVDGSKTGERRHIFRSANRREWRDPPSAQSQSCRRKCSLRAAPFCRCRATPLPASSAASQPR